MPIYVCLREQRCWVPVSASVYSVLYKYHKNSYEISEMSKSGFFLSRSHIELVGIRDFQAKQGESRRDRDGWTV